MNKEKIYIFDTTLRDGAQTEGVDFSVEDKHKIAKILSNIGVDYIEGGWPGANPIDNEFFDKSPNLGNSKFTAFGMTKKNGVSADNDPNLSPLMNADCKTVCVVGKTWDFHVKTALGIKNEDNLKNLYNYCLSANIQIEGLMCIPPNDVDPKPFFQKMVSLRDSIDLSLKLSMGMSNDYKIALDHGSNLIRVGSYIFK